jgi:N-hydroxyarylamine O-acetyltransferase
MMHPAALQAYCKRIGYQGELTASPETLQALHALHPLAIPFENLNSWLGLPVSLEPEAIFSKLVLQRRGGYCFEQNLLFMAVLRTIGFNVQGLAARVLWNLPADCVLPRTHMLLLVELEQQRYVADVGFGGLTMTAALQLNTEAEQSSSHEAFRIQPQDNFYVIKAFVADNWQALYQFSLEPQLPADYELANWYVSTHPDSRFISQLIAGRADSGARHALLDARYNRHLTGATTEQRMLASPAAVRQVLEDVLLIDTGTLPGLDARLNSLFREA